MIYALVTEWAKGNPRRIGMIADMRQDCLLKWCEVRDRYIALPDKRAKGAARKTIRHYFIELHRKRSAQKRAGDATLDELPDELPITRPPPDQDLPIAIAQVLPRLPLLQRRICELRLEDKSFAEIARELDTDRNEISREIAKIEEKFRRWGLLPGS